MGKNILCFTKSTQKMHLLWMTCILTILVTCVVTESENCKKDICSRVRCRSVDKAECKENETYEEKGGYCGCCAACVPKKEQCGPNACATVLCLAVCEEDCKTNQIYDPKGGYCGCCPACITQLKKGQKCQQPVKGGSPPTKRCKKGLVCDPNTNRCKAPCGDPDSSSSEESY